MCPRVSGAVQGMELERLVVTRGTQRNAFTCQYGKTVESKAPKKKRRGEVW